MKKENDLKVFINAFETMAMAAGWPKAQWSAILILCLIGLAQQAVDTLPLQDLCDYKNLQPALLQTLNLNSEAYHQWLREIEFGMDFHPCLIGQCIWDACVQWPQLEEHTKDEIVEAICMEHYVALLPFKPKHWMICHQPRKMPLALWRHIYPLKRAYTL